MRSLGQNPTEAELQGQFYRGFIGLLTTKKVGDEGVRLALVGEMMKYNNFLRYDKRSRR